MTYCVAVKLKQGLVMASDSRTNAGIDHLATFRKMSVFQAEDRILVLLSAGNLATTQSVVSLLQQQIGSQDDHLENVHSLYDAASLVGSTLRTYLSRHAERNELDSGVDYSCTFILGGSIKGHEHRLFTIYPQGNFIEASEDTPYFQIGESKYGKPILDRVIRYDTNMMQAVKCVLVSFDSTIRSNLSVGLPLDILLIHEQEIKPSLQHRFLDGDPYLVSLRESWSQGLKTLFQSIPEPPWTI